jgi:hypothetical protein
LVKSGYNLSDIKELDISGIELDNIEWLADCSSLQKLVVHQTSESTGLSDAQLKLASYYNPNLRSVDLTSTTTATEAGLKLFLSNCKDLREIIIDNCQKANDQWTKLIIKYCPNLEALSAVNCEFLTAVSTSLLNTLPLRSLNIFNCDMMARGLEDLSCSNLTTLSIAATPTNDQLVVKLATKFPQLTHIDLSNCVSLTDASLIAFGEHCPHLESINVSGNPAITDTGLEAIATTHLQRVIINHCSKITNSMEILSKNCPNLQHLEQICVNVTPTGLALLGDNCPLLTTIWLEYIGSVLQGQLIYLFERCHKLENIHVMRCCWMEEKLIEVIANNLRELKCLHLRKLSITDRSFNYLLKCTKLAELELFELHQYSNVSVEGTTLVF